MFHETTAMLETQFIKLVTPVGGQGSGGRNYRLLKKAGFGISQSTVNTSAAEYILCSAYRVFKL